MTDKIIYRVHEGQDLSQAKAIEIARSKGTVTIAVGEATARVVGGDWFSARKPMVSWASYGQVDPWMAEDHATAVAAAAKVAKLADQYPSQFDTCPGWVATELGIDPAASELVRYRAASRYNNGDIDYNGAWRYAIELTRQESDR